MDFHLFNLKHNKRYFFIYLLNKIFFEVHYTYLKMAHLNKINVGRKNLIFYKSNFF